MAPVRLHDAATVGSPTRSDDTDQDRKTVEITDVTADGTRIESTVECSDDLAPFFDASSFYAEYDVDVSELPRSILSIPVLAQMCPVAWAVGADVHVPEVDRRFLDSLERVGRTLCEMYPFMQGGRVVAESAPEPRDGSAVTSEGADDDPTAAGDQRPGVADGAGLLFTGGINSLSPYVRHREERPTLIATRAWHVGPGEDRRWAQWRGNVREYAERFGVDAQFVETNLLEVVDSRLLSIRFTDEHDGGWYSAVGDGLGFLGLVAPLTVAEDIGTLYIGARHWEGFPTPAGLDHWEGRGMPWGSHPDIDEAVRWGGTTVCHDGFELTRQERVELVAEFLADEHPDLPVWACEESERRRNCNRCENCFRTALGLALAGRDPARHELPLDPAAFEFARERFETGEWLPDRHHAEYWRELRDRLDADTDLPVEGSEPFRQWLRAADLDAVAGSPVRDRAVRTVARAVPLPAYAVLSRSLDALGGK
ncbi:hypothetical protein [Halosimplex salinum]|uniref:hypothetical protein n=1 Tax=Halosimplex salinum TaxID=1710538 RepID=UPI001F1E821E|nr:hypothetical protein [Halosimplex salinum]